MSRFEYEPQRDAMITAIPRGGSLPGVVPLHQKQSGASSAQGVEPIEEIEASDDEWEAQYQEAVALVTGIDFWRPFQRVNEESCLS